MLFGLESAELKHKGFVVCLVSELMLVSGIILMSNGIILISWAEIGGCRVTPCPTTTTFNSFTRYGSAWGVMLTIASAVGFAIGLCITWLETTRSGTAS
jgi:hypothetical protein